MWFLFVSCIFKLQGQRIFKFQRHQVCENSDIMDLNDFSVFRTRFSGQILELKTLILNPQSTICQLYLTQSEIPQPSELKGLPFLQNQILPDRCLWENLLSKFKFLFSVSLSNLFFSEIKICKASLAQEKFPHN